MPRCSPPPTPATPASLQGATCDNPLDWRQAADHIGQSAAVLGPIMKVTYKPSSRGQPTWIDLGASFPSKRRLGLVVWGEHRPAFASLLAQPLEGRTVCVIGRIEQYKGVPPYAETQSYVTLVRSLTERYRRQR